MATLKITAVSEGFAQAQANFDALSKAEQKAVVQGSAIGGSLAAAGRRGKQGLDSLLASAVGMGTGMAVAHKGIDLLTSSLRRLHDERERGASLVKESAPALGQLAQLTRGAPGKLPELIRSARKTALETGMPIAQAAEFQFAIQSGELGEEDRAVLAQLAPVMGGSPTAMTGLTQGVAGVRKAFGGGAGGIRSILNKGIIGAEVATGQGGNIAEFLPEFAGISPAIKGTKTSPEEGMAALAQLSQVSGGGVPMAGTQIQAFAKVMAEKGLSGKGLVGAAQEIAGKGMSDRKIQEYFGRQEAFKGFQNLLQMAGEIEKLTTRLKAADQAAAGGTDAVAGVVESFMAIPELRASFEQQRESAAMRDFESGPAGAKQVERQTTLMRIQREQRQAGVGIVGRSISSMRGKAAGMIEEAIEDSGGQMKPGSLVEAAARGKGSKDLTMTVAAFIKDMFGGIQKTNKDGKVEVEISDSSADKIASAMRRGRQLPADAGMSVE